MLWKTSPTKVDQYASAHVIQQHNGYFWPIDIDNGDVGVFFIAKGETIHLVLVRCIMAAWVLIVLLDIYFTPKWLYRFNLINQFVFNFFPIFFHPHFYVFQFSFSIFFFFRFSYFCFLFLPSSTLTSTSTWSWVEFSITFQFFDHPAGHPATRESRRN